MKSLTASALKIGTKTRMRYPRTNALKRSGTLLRSPNRPPKFESMVMAPLSVFVGHFRRMRRERYTKPARAEYVRATLLVRDSALAKELGLA